MLFGTDMDEDVVELRQKFNSLIAYASSQSKVITLNSHHIQRIEQHLVYIHSFTHRLVASFNSAMNTFNKLLVFEQALSALQTSVSSLLHTNGILVQNIVETSRSRFTSTLFPTKDFLHVLALGASEHKFTPFFDHQAVHHSYPLLESFLTPDSVVIHVPFKSGDVFEVYQVKPFPFSVNGSLKTLDSSSSVVLIHQELSLYVTTCPSNFQSCRLEHLYVYFCSVSLFLFLPITGNTDASLALSTCPYHYVVPQPIFHTRFSGFH